MWLSVAGTAAGSARPPADQLKTKIGIADQKPGVFDDERLGNLGVGYARHSVPWDALRFPEQVADLDAWVRGAQRIGAEPMITFSRSRDLPRRHKPPGSNEFLIQFRRFRARYPSIRTYSSWNEANHCGTGTCRKPYLVASYFDAIRRNCPGCKVVAADLLDQPNLAGWARAFRRATHVEPRYWALHGYIDANRFQTVHTRALLGAVKGEIWLTEIGGIVARRNRSQIKLPAGKAHAARATRFIFDRLGRVSPRITRIYLYHWSSSTPFDSWDSALIGADGKRRPALAVLERVLRQSRARSSGVGRRPRTGR